MKRLILACLLFWTTGPAVASTPTFGMNLSIDCPSGRPMSIVSTVPKPIYAEVIRFVSKAEAAQRLSLTEMRSGETIDPAYANDQRVVVEWPVKGHTYARTFVAVPAGMAVHIGEGVYFVTGHGDPTDLCLFIPNLIMR